MKWELIIFLENSLIYETCLDILILNFIKNTIYVNKQTLKVLKKIRQLDNPVAKEDYCRRLL